MPWPVASRLESKRLILTPLSVDLAAPMVSVLADDALYLFTGGEPPKLEQLRNRYAAQVIGGTQDGTQRWLNWIVNRRDAAAPVGFVQATVHLAALHPNAGHPGTVLPGTVLPAPDGAVADLAWLIGSANQGQGLASEATRMMMRFLRGQGITGFAAFIHPDHVASQTVARHQHLHPTAQVHDGEVRWESGREQTRK